MIGPYDLDTIVVGDCIELGKQIPDESVDLIFTDPPWDDASMPLYEWLAEISARVLKPGGFVVAYTGNDWLPEIMGYFGAYLNWFRMFSGVQLESDDKYFKKKLFVKWRPIIVYSKGEPAPISWAPDALHTNRDKRFHPWGQGEKAITRWINAMSKPDDVVFEPFCGGGTTPAVAKVLGRHYLSFEINPDTARIARRRLENTQPPLFTVQPEQSLLFATS